MAKRRRRDGPASYGGGDGEQHASSGGGSGVHAGSLKHTVAVLTYCRGRWTDWLTRRRACRDTPLDFLTSNTNKHNVTSHRPEQLRSYALRLSLKATGALCQNAPFACFLQAGLIRPHCCCWCCCCYAAGTK